ncbi:MAG TPA: DUF1566 domain-containing protein [Burkholderiaceae bacterium]|nr:DUF1566 domain-containing protein [Burkholderiaceae bacterium]
MKSIRLTLNAIVLTLATVLTACSGGGDESTAPAETTTGGTTAGAGTTATTPETTTPTTGFARVANPAGGDYGLQCAIDYSTGLIWEGKNPNPSHPQGIGRTYTNFDDADKYQVTDLVYGVGDTKPSLAGINAASNSIGYVNAINSLALCGFSNWRLPTRDELIALGKLSSKLADFPETISGTYWSSSLSDRDHSGIVVRPPATSGNKEYRVNSFGIRLVRSSS